MRQQGKVLAALNDAERQALLDGPQAEREALGVEVLDGAMEGKVGKLFRDIAGVEMTEADALAVSAKIDQAAAAVKNVGEMGARSLASAAKITVWTKVFIGVNILAIIVSNDGMVLSTLTYASPGLLRLEEARKTLT